jgi:hypothetical protein
LRFERILRTSSTVFVHYLAPGEHAGGFGCGFMPR